MKLSKDQFTFLFTTLMDRPPRADEADIYFARCHGDAYDAVRLIGQTDEFAARYPTLIAGPIASGPIESSAAAEAIHDEPWIAAAMRQILRPGAIFLDVGANVGRHTMLGAQLVGPTGRVYALEADLEVAARLQANARRGRFGNVVVVPRAVADGKRVEFNAAGAGQGALAARREPGDRQKYAFDPVLTDTLDSSLGHVERIDLIRLHLAGLEGAALKGAEQLLSRRPMVLVRCTPDGDDGRLAGWLIDHGYEMTLISRDAPEPLGQDMQALRDSTGGSGASRPVDIVFSPREAAFRLVDSRPRSVVVNGADPRLVTALGRRENGMLHIEVPGAGTERHYAMFGPYLWLAGGRYRATVDMTIPRGADGVLLDVCHRRGTVILGAADAREGGVDFELTETATDLEIRLQVPGGFQGVVRRVSIQPNDLDRPDVDEVET